jgi:hypothetical protein
VAAVPKAPAVAVAIGTSAGCLTSAAQRIGVPIPDLRIPMRLATPAEAKRMCDDGNLFVGSCNYHVSGGNHCSHPDLQLRMCNHGMCRIKIHHLCQLEWEEAMGFEETTISRCQVHHPRVPHPLQNAQVPVATMPTLPPLTITNQRYNMSGTPPESQLTLDSDFEFNDDGSTD